MKRADRFAILAATCIQLGAFGCASAERDPGESFDVGRTPRDGEIQSYDTDIGPLGDGLPVGSGLAAHGEVVYRQRCAYCHGANGEGTAAASQLVPPADSAMPRRRNITTHWPYAPPLLDYILRAMPADTPGVLTHDEGYAVVAYLLRQSGITTHDRLDATLITNIAMPARSRFVPDDRKGGREIR